MVHHNCYGSAVMLLLLLRLRLPVQILVGMFLLLKCVSKEFGIYGIHKKTWKARRKDDKENKKKARERERGDEHMNRKKLDY